MSVVLKNLSEKVKEVSSGAVALAVAGQPMTKKSLLCRTGTFEGLYGRVTVTTQMLKGIAERYNRDRATPQNENDYAPILKDHERKVDYVLGRILTGLTCEEWQDPATGEAQLGLYGELRIDDEEAKKKVEQGLYAHLSISFDEDTLELFEVSFVAVEAARRSIILSQKETKKMSIELQQKFEKLASKKTALAAAIKEHRSARVEKVKSLSTASKALQTEAVELSKKAQAISLSVKTAQLKGKFSGFIKLGKMNPIEFKELDFTELAQMSEKSLQVVLSSYEKRPVSSDVIQHGQEARSEQVRTDLSKEAMRKAIELQRAGKTVALSDMPADGGEDKGKEDIIEVPAMSEDPMKSYTLSDEDWKKTLEEMGMVHTKLSEVIEKIKGLGADVEQLSAAEDDQDKKEQELAADEKEEPIKKEGEE